ncbi:MAG: hypothetical protein MHMPM18_002798 [Marteilia pararefringens]
MKFPNQKTSNVLKPRGSGWANYEATQANVFNNFKTISGEENIDIDYAQYRINARLDGRTATIEVVQRTISTISELWSNKSIECNCVDLSTGCIKYAASPFKKYNKIYNMKDYLIAVNKCTEISLGKLKREEGLSEKKVVKKLRVILRRSLRCLCHIYKVDIKNNSEFTKSYFNSVFKCFTITVAHSGFLKLISSSHEYRLLRPQIEGILKEEDLPNTKDKEKKPKCMTKKSTSIF